jgi:hypothetical protein
MYETTSVSLLYAIGILKINSPLSFVTVPIVVPLTNTDENGNGLLPLFSTIFPLITLKVFCAFAKHGTNSTSTARVKYSLMFGINN